MKKILSTLLAAFVSASLPTLASARVYGGSENLEAFPISAVKVTSPTFLHVQMLAKDYILGLDADRLLAPYYKEAGVAPLAENYPNWENTGLDGHIGGHYLSALAYMYAATGDARLKERMDYMVSQLSKIQASDGYLSGVVGGKSMWADVFSGKIEAGAFSLNGKWVPLYNIHKIMAGLRDAYRVGGSDDAKIVFIKLCSWFETNAAKLTDEQIQSMLVSEYGGLNEIMADAYEITGEHRFLSMARRMTHNYILDPLKQKEDKLNGIHANTQIPKVIGIAKVAEVDHDSDWRNAADFFWHTVTDNRTVTIGGNSVREHFNPADDFSSMIESEQGPETCNTYNMLRLTKMLFLSAPDSRYVDFYERAMLNHILSSINEVQGGFVYFTSMRPGHYRVYSQPQTSFWCCVGSGIENHSRYGEMVYSHKGKDELYVNTFLPSLLNWDANKTDVEITGDFPWKESAQIVVRSRKPRQWTLKIRKPEWSSDFCVDINGEKYTEAGDDGYIAVKRTWGAEDVVSVSMPMCLSVKALPDGSDYYSYLYGPMVLAADLGKENQLGIYADDSRGGHIAMGPKMNLSEVPIWVADDDPLAHIRRDGDTWQWSVDCIRPDKYASLKLVPFVKLSEHRYQVYFRKLSTETYENKMEQLRILDEARKALEAKTVDVVVCGEQQPESDHGFAQGSSFSGGDLDSKHWRETDSWFSYVLKVGVATKLSLSYQQAADREAVVVCGDSTVELLSGEDGFRTIEFPLSGVNGQTVTVKIAAKSERRLSPRIFEVRTVK